jgi:hypothetical protein
MTGDEISDQVRTAAATVLAAADYPGVVTRAGLVVERVHAEDGEHATSVSTFTTSNLPWETAGLLGYARHQVLRVDDAGGDEG